MSTGIVARTSHIGVVLEAVVNLSRALAAPRSTPFGATVLTRRQLDILFVLAHASGPVTPGALAGTLRVTPGAITQAVDPLRAAGLVEHSSIADDGRVRVITLTTDARTQVDAFEAVTVSRAAPWFVDLDDEELAQLASLVSAVKVAG